VFLNAWGVYTYSGGSVSNNPGITASVNFGIGELSNGNGWGLSGGVFGAVAQVGNGFGELGIGTPGFGISVYTVKEVISWSSIDQSMQLLGYMLGTGR
jgi:hypothetical protein